MRRLIRDVNVSEVQAAAMLGNIGWECGGFKALQEVKPVMGGPRRPRLVPVDRRAADLLREVAERQWLGGQLSRR